MKLIAIADDESLVGAMNEQADLLVSLGDLYDHPFAMPLRR